MTARFRRWAGVALVVVVVVWLGVILHGLTGRVTKAEGQTATALSAADRLARQVKRMGGTPVVEPSNLQTPASSAKDGADGAAGAAGSPGATGATGARGPGPTQAQIRAALRAVCGTCVGATGPKGATGQDGSTGATGAQGATGPAGSNGSDGAPGTTGPAGYPTSFSFTYLGATYTCTDPDGDRAYSCEGA